MVSPGSICKPSGALRPVSRSRSASQRFLDRMTGEFGQRLAVGRLYPRVGVERGATPDRPLGIGLAVCRGCNRIPSPRFSGERVRVRGSPRC